MTRAALAVLIFCAVGDVLRADVVVRVPAGRELKATLQGVTAAVRIQPSPRIVQFQFGWKDASSQFRAYPPSEPIVYDREFVIRVHYDSEPPFETTNITLTWEGGSREVPVIRTHANPRVFESTELFYPNLAGCKGLSVCEPQEDWGVENDPY